MGLVSLDRLYFLGADWETSGLHVNACLSNLHVVRIYLPIQKCSKSSQVLSLQKFRLTEVLTVNFSLLNHTVYLPIQ